MKRGYRLLRAVVALLFAASMISVTSTLSGCSGGNDVACTPALTNTLIPSDAPAVRGVDPSTPRLPDVSVQALFSDSDKLAEFRRRARRGNSRIKSAIASILREADKSWPYGSVATVFGVVDKGTTQSDKFCVALNRTCVGDILTEAGKYIYSRVLAYHFTDETRFAEEARDILLSFAGSSGFDEVDGKPTFNGANQCALNLSFVVPLIIESALLLEVYPGWSANDKSALQQWLAVQAYPVTAAIARTRKNNWGNAAAFASWSIGHYLLDSGLMLTEVHPEKRELTPQRAREVHVQMQQNIIGNRYARDSRCDLYGVQPHGGIPDELRRGSSGCDADYLEQRDLSFSYQVLASTFLTGHALALKRHGNNELFKARLPNGAPVLLQAALFVIDNESGRSQDWPAESLGVLRAMNSEYADERLCRQLENNRFFIEGRYLPFTQLTFVDICSDT